MQIIGRELFAVLLQLPAGRPDRFHLYRHIGLFGGAPAFLHIARRAGGDDVLPCRAPTQPARGHMVKGQAVRAAAILALEMVTQEHIETCVFHILGPFFRRER